MNRPLELINVLNLEELFCILKKAKQILNFAENREIIGRIWLENEKKL